MDMHDINHKTEAEQDEKSLMEAENEDCLSDKEKWM